MGVDHLFVRLSDFVEASGAEWANGTSIWNSRSKLSRWSALEIDVMSARTGQDTGPYYAYNRVSQTAPSCSTLGQRIPFGTPALFAIATAFDALNSSDHLRLLANHSARTEKKYHLPPCSVSIVIDCRDDFHPKDIFFTIHYLQKYTYASTVPRAPQIFVAPVDGSI